jgi:serine/threonine protein kinase
MENTLRKPNIDRTLRDKRAASIFPPVKLKVAETAGRVLSSTNGAPSRVQKPSKPSQQSSTTKQLQLVRTLNSGNTSQAERKGEQVHFRDPWSSYQKMVYYDDSDDVVGALSIPKRRVARTIVRVSPPLNKERIQKLLDIRHKHIVLLHEVFQSTDTFLVYETMHISLDVLLIGCGEKFKEPQIARICHEVSATLDHYSVELMGKLLLAILNLTSKGLQHGSITPSNVFFTSSGITKLGTCRADLEALKADY